MIQSLANVLRRRQQKWNSGQMLSILAHSSLEVHCSYRLKFFVANNHLRSSSASNCSLLCSRFARSCSPRPSQRSKYTEGVALRMRICNAVQRLSRKCVQKKNTLGTEYIVRPECLVLAVGCTYFHVRTQLTVTTMTPFEGLFTWLNHQTTTLNNLFHFNGSHYNIIVADNEDSRLSSPPLSNFECTIVC